MRRRADANRPPRALPALTASRRNFLQSSPLKKTGRKLKELANLQVSYKFASGPSEDLHVNLSKLKVSIPNRSVVVQRIVSKSIDDDTRVTVGRASVALHHLELQRYRPP